MNASDCLGSSRFGRPLTSTRWVTRLRGFSGWVGFALGLAVAGGITLAPGATWASFHFMQIEQAIGGVDGDTSAQAVQLRMRAVGQNQMQFSRLVVWDASGSNPIVLVAPAAPVPGGAQGDRVLIASANFANNTNPPAVPDYVMANAIPAAYLDAGSLTFENAAGTIVYWRVSWGGALYTGSTTGSTTNDLDGEFGPPVNGALPSTGVEALQFQGAANALSTANALDYALTAAAAVFTNNAGSAFTVEAPSPTAFYHGIANTPLGQAQLSVPPKAIPTIQGHEHLVVSNIGSSGDDGVCIQVGASDGGLIEWLALPNPTTLDDGYSVFLDAIGIAGGVGGQNIGSVSAVDIGSSAQLSADYSALGATTHRLEFYDDGNLVQVVEGYSGTVDVSLMPNACEYVTTRVPNPLPSFPPTFVGPFHPSPGFAWHWDANVDFTVTGLPAFSGDAVHMLAGASGDGLFMEQLDLRVADPSRVGGTLTLADEALRIFARKHRGKGGGNIECAPPSVAAPQIQRSSNNTCLTVSNIGASGDDGVSLDVNPNEIEVGMRFVSLDLQGAPGPGSLLRLSADATILGAPGQPVGEASFTGAAAGAQASADFNITGSSTARLELYLAGQLVFSQGGLASAVDVPADWPDGGCAFFDPSASVLGFGWVWDTSINVTIPGGPTILADEVRLLTENLTFNYDKIDAVHGHGVTPSGELLLLRETVTVDGVPSSGWLSAASIGFATLDYSTDDRLVVSNIGASGDDGVCVEVDPSLDLFRTDWAPLGDMTDFPDGTFAVAATGLLSGDGSSRDLGAIDFDNGASPTGIELRTDYSSIGAQQVRVIVIDDNVNVADFNIADGLVAELPEWPDGVGIEPVNYGGGPALSYWVDPGDNVLVDFLNAGPMKAGGSLHEINMKIQADLLRLIALDASAPLEAVHTFGIGGTLDIPRLILTRQGADHPTDVLPNLPRFTVLHPSVPNPFNPRTMISFELARPGNATLQVFSPQGRLVATLFRGYADAGLRTFVWSGIDSGGRRVASGTYFVRLDSLDGVASQKVTLLK